MLAIVLKRRDWQEYDQIISIYTVRQGKLDILAKGVKKIISKNSAHLEPFSLVEVNLVAGKELDRLTTVQPVEIFKKIRQDLRKSLVAGYAVDFLNKMVPIEEKDEKIWDMLLSWLSFLHQTTQINDNLLYGFVIKTLSLLGFKPELTNCAVCGNISEYAGFDISSGVVCSGCVQEEILKCGSDQLEKMQILLSADWKKINSLPIDKKLFNLIFRFAEYHSEKKIINFNSSIYASAN